MCIEEKNDRFVKVFVKVYMYAWYLYNRFVVDMCMSSLPRTLLLSNLSPNTPPISHLFPLFMRFLEWLVTSFSSSFLSIYLCYLLRWWCIMIVFKMTSIRCNAHIRCHFRSYKTSYKSIFLYILYIIYRNFQCNGDYLLHLYDDISCSSVYLHVLNRSYSIKTNESK